MTNQVLGLTFSSDTYNHEMNLAVLWGTMLWPDSESRRKDFQDWIKKRLFLPHASDLPSEFRDWFIQSILSKDYDTDAFEGRDMRRRVVHGRVAGAILSLRLQGWTMSQAKDALSKSRSKPNAYPGLWDVGAGPPIRVQRDTIQGLAWKRHRSVSHLWAASFDAGISGRPWLPENREEWVRFLKSAQDYRERGESSGILIPEEMFRVLIILPEGL